MPRTWRWMGQPWTGSFFHWWTSKEVPIIWRRYWSTDVSSSRMMAHPQMEEIRGRTKIVTESRVFSPSNVRACTEGFQRVNRWGRRTPSVLLVEDRALLNYMPYFRVNYLTSVSESTWKICCHEAGTESRLTTCLISSSSYIYILQTKLFHLYNCLLPLIMSNVQT